MSPNFSPAAMSVSSACVSPTTGILSTILPTAFVVFDNPFSREDCMEVEEYPDI